MTKFRSVVLIASAALSSALPAQDDQAPTPSEMPGRISFLVAFGEEKCREAVDDEIVVCAHVPENERYRIPVALRTEQRVITDRSWTSAVETLDSFARDLRPDSCSVNGSGGFTGCTQKILQQWFAEMRGSKAAD